MFWANKPNGEKQGACVFFHPDFSMQHVLCLVIRSTSFL